MRNFASERRPGCSTISFVSGTISKSLPGAASDMNSSVTLRPAPACDATAADGVSFTRMPAASQITR